jgi:hypothetical protein
MLGMSFAWHKTTKASGFDKNVEKSLTSPMFDDRVHAGFERGDARKGGGGLRKKAKSFSICERV